MRLCDDNDYDDYEDDDKSPYSTETGISWVDLAAFCSFRSLLHFYASMWCISQCQTIG